MCTLILTHALDPTLTVDPAVWARRGEHARAVCMHAHAHMQVAWRTRRDEHAADRTASLRLVLEYGSTLAGTCMCTCTCAYA